MIGGEAVKQDYRNEREDEYNTGDGTRASENAERIVGGT